MRSSTRLLSTTGYAPGTQFLGNSCKGASECQFKNSATAIAFCNAVGTCTSIIQHASSGYCAGDFGCFTPRSGALEPAAGAEFATYIGAGKVYKTNGGMTVYNTTGLLMMRYNN